MAALSSASESGEQQQHGARHPPERRLLLLGGPRAGKTSTANTILGDEVFEAGAETTHSNVGQTEIYGRRVTVVDTPPWTVVAVPHPGSSSSSGGGGGDPENDNNTDENDNDAAADDPPQQQQPQPTLDSEGPCMGAILCPPGPHALLLVVSVSQPFTEVQRRAAEEQLAALGGGTWRYSMVLFTGVDRLPTGTFIEEHISNTGEALQWLVERCGSRYHAFDNASKETSGEDNTQVPELMEKVEELITDNQGWYFEVNELILLEEEQARKALEEERMRMEEHIRQREQMIGGPPRELRVLLLGWKGVGKSSVGNSILGGRAFEAGQETELCLRRQALASGQRRVTVVDTPGWDWFSVRRTPKRVRHETQRGAALLRPGPHTLLLVLPVVSSLTARKRRTLQAHLEALFGERSCLHTMVLFSCGDWLGHTPIEEHIQRGGRELHRLLAYCGNYYHVMDCKVPAGTGTRDGGGGGSGTGGTGATGARCVSELLDKIEEMIRENVENGDEAFLPVQDEWLADESSQSSDNTEPEDDCRGCQLQ